MLKKIMLIAIGIFAFLIILGLIIGTDEDKKTASATTDQTTSATMTEPVPEPAAGLTDQEIAQAAEQYMKDNLGFSGEWIDYTSRCLSSGIPDDRCWQPFVNGFNFDAGTLTVTLQVDRADSTAMGQNAARHIANFLRESNDPWRQEIDWVQVVDGAGTHIAQESVG